MIFEAKKIECLVDSMLFKIYRISGVSRTVILVTTKAIRKLGHFDLSKVVFNIYRFTKHAKCAGGNS